MKKETTSFIYMGDPQCSRINGAAADYSRWAGLLDSARAFESENAAGVRQENSRLLVLGGDIVNRGNREEEWRAFFNAYDSSVDMKERSRSIMVTPVNGAKESVGAFADRFLNRGNGPAGYEKNFFSFDYGCCHFMVLDSDYMGHTARGAWKYIGRWIKGDLSANTKPVVFAVMHYPMYTLGTSFEDDVRAGAMRKNYMELLYRYGVDFILCGHQHAYCRSREMGPPSVTQVMGVSGTKHFDAWNADSMEICRENVLAATIFETDGTRITLNTIDENGGIIDSFSKAVRSPKEHRAEAKAAITDDPFRPSNEHGIAVEWDGTDREILMSDEQIAGLDQVEVEYSVMRRNGLVRETKQGVRLDDVLETAGWNAPEEDTDSAVILTSGNGLQRILRLNDVLESACFGEKDDGGFAVEWIVPGILFEENGGYRLAFGQKTPEQFNGRMWAADVRKIEIRKM